jgi:hypothetical protein
MKHAIAERLDGLPPNGLRFTRAAPIDRNVVRAHLDAKIATILSTRSGVGCKRLLCRLVRCVLFLCIEHDSDDRLYDGYLFKY